MDSLKKAAELIPGARALVFDFDGTLVDSNPIKWRAFEVCFGDFPDQLPEILAYCRSFNHTPRDVKFRSIYETILRRPYGPDIEQGLLKRFERETTEQIIEAAEIPGAEELLRSVCRTHETAVLSSTPSEPLRAILERRGWKRYFKWIQGAPVDKARWLRELRSRQGIPLDSIIFFGDTAEDRDAALKSRCRFVHVGDTLETAPGIFTIPNYEKLTAILQEVEQC